MRRPSGLKAAALRPASCPRSTRGSVEPSASHTLAVLSHDAETMRLPSGLHDAALTLASCPWSTGGWPALSAFHPFTAFTPAETTRWPSGLHDADESTSCPLRIWGSPFPSALHTLTVLSQDV